jgi:hypothetical protein
VYNIREATMEDWPVVWEMAQGFYQFAPYPIHPPIDEASTQELFESMLRSGEVLLGTFEEVPVAMIGALYAPYVVNTNYLTGTEMMWWVDEEHRGSKLGMQLHKLAEQHADEKGCIWFAMSEMATSPPGVGVYLERSGYKRIEATYLKELN